VITLSYRIKISAVCSFASSQITHVTEGRTDRQNYDPHERASIAASRGKNSSKSKTTTGTVPVCVLPLTRVLTKWNLLSLIVLTV